MTGSSWRISRVDRTRVLVVPDLGAGGVPAAVDRVARTGGRFGDGEATIGARNGPGEAAPAPAAATAPAAPVGVGLRPGGVLPAVVGDDVTPAVGDRLVTAPGHRPGDPDRFLVAPRTGELLRDTVDRTSRSQVVAANVDVVLVVEPLDPSPSIGRVERLVTLAWRSGASPVVVLTKTDLVHDTAHWLADLAAAAPGVPVRAVSATTGDGVAELLRLVEPGATLVAVGRSGAGKSTLVNALVGEDVMATGERRGDGKGRHTTTHRELVDLALPDGGRAWLIDTPGLRAVGLVADEESVEATFAEVADLAAGCRFGDCRHEREPGCAVVAALEEGTLSERRYAAYRAQLREAHHAAVRADARLAAAQRTDWKRRTVAMREHHRVTGKGRR
ncbi:ribosome small subunit-dependent GTPase A [Serinibacter arcticus]|uniref:Small ribosomal subunit biogenesis GTPase RsgA n=1 Tax=Serinibacter arcticus TaxID=1655435 RepID=A0A2U1ZXN4_9MICO|nr:ribosome small subunit-dependent GTPase A [Serinibacter arcticus]PWD51748.1 ribosome small subunit-dependent GTPase A [Serinibacter arcticus]